ncbi:MAG: 2-oxoglutarate dehydrogenase E1 component [Deltaproteobacteria bacterium]|nr:MAG: 2-oxoglutarate dehydrogenase E1 component [Deltaproteobacteria bacterium]
MNQDFGVNQALVEDQYRRYLDNPMAVDDEWRSFFEGLTPEQANRLRDDGGGPSSSAAAGADRALLYQSELAWRLSQLVTAYRTRGHIFAKLDPLDLENRSTEELRPESFGIAESDLDVEVHTDIPGHEKATPRQIIALMRETYCSTVGAEIMGVEDPEERAWLLNQFEGSRGTELSADEHRWVLQRLTDAEELERFIHQQYLGAKRFSLEGLETLIPMLHLMLDEAAELGARRAVIGMAHRGRLNVLVNIMRKQLKELFSAFNDDASEELLGRGDVKYHLGYRTDHKARDGRTVNVALCFNPSHLEFVNPVVVGRARALLDRGGESEGGSVLPLCIHGDAAFIGQGIVYETLNLAELEGYRVGGTVHIVLNNQVGFTTSPSDSRSCRYATDAMSFLRVPVFHVNAEDVDAVVRVTRIAVAYRQRFGRDVAIDLVGYRRFGHNEGDEPRFTQPQMYERIDGHPSVRELLARRMVERGELDEAGSESMVKARRERMMAALRESRENGQHGMPTLDEDVWSTYEGGMEAEAAQQYPSVSLETLQSLLRGITTIPEGVNAHPKVRKLYEQRAKALDPDQPFDWGVGEALAYASLVNGGVRVRLSGQDSRRGTFSHRHAYLVDTKNGRRWTPYSAVEGEGGIFEAFDSPLSEAACMGFEYGYSLESPDALILWEAQFGDFANGAQVILDQFMASGEDKWGRLTGMVLLLPHGFEGQGPEHSYARLGRFLQSCAEDNMQVCDCTTPAQFYHLLRRQMLARWRKPLVVMTPKSLLRHKRAVSTLKDLADGTFHRIIPDVSGTAPDRVRRVLLCSGRVYYDLEEEREKREATDVHILRLEQLYPLDGNLLAQLLAPYAPGTELCWVQDEPWNMGAWYFIQARLTALFGTGLPLQCISRAESASPATGSASAHRLENRQLLDAAFSTERFGH